MERFVLISAILLKTQVFNVCFKKTWTNHSSDTVLWFVQIFLKQTLWYIVYTALLLSKISARGNMG